MDLDRCTQGQRETIETLGRPLMVSAGAGSGKTFTLTQRIVFGFSPGTGEGGEPFLRSIDEVLAITFTRKAAAELRSRIKTLLASEGLVDEALAVDDGWVTTIHGMASRILRENALEFGIDPGFQVLSQAEQDELLYQAVEGLAGDEALLADEGLDSLLAVESLYGKGDHSQGLVDDAQRILGRAASMPEGLDSVLIAEPRLSPSALMNRMLELGEAFAMHAGEWQKPGATETKVLDALGEAIVGAKSWLESEQAALDFADPSFDADAFRGALYGFPTTSRNAPTKKNRTEFFDDYDAAYAHVAEETEASMGAVRTQQVLRLARQIERRYDELKGPNRFDNNDLLRRCVRALEDHPVIAERYRRRFKLIMVDEFQDTDGLQVALIRLLAAPGLANVCTVGDAQQSIYRFRGADVNVFLAYGRALAAENPCARFPKLDSNFRSHGDVLAFVERIFSQREAFGERFLKLEARGSVNAVANPVFTGEDGEFLPRVSVDVVAFDPHALGLEKSTSAQALSVAASHVADHFASLRDRGARPEGMALLLGGMTHADAYAKALRERGIESVITGGSVFSRSSAARLVAALLRFAVNVGDGAALLTVLLSPLFALSDDALMALCTNYDEEGRLHYGDLARGFSRAAFAEEIAGLSANDREALRLATTLLERFAADASADLRGGPARALRALFAESGLLDRLQAEGTDGVAWAGDLQKACLLVEAFERESGGIASTSRAFDDHLRASKEAPGMLSSTSSLPLRIMTIHASKGLQFEHVVVAEAGEGKVRGRGMAVENVGNRTYASYAAPVSAIPVFAGVRRKLHARALEAAKERWSDSESILEALEGEGALSLDPGEMSQALAAWERLEARAEAQRLLYVGLTRAVESVYLSIRTSAKPDDEYASAGIYREVFTAFPWDAEAQRSRSAADFGGSAPAEVTFEKLVGCDEREDDEVEEAAVPSGKDEERSEAFEVIVRESLPLPVLVPCSFGRENVRSYSSLDHSGYAEAASSHAMPASAMSPYDDLALVSSSDDVAEAALLSYGVDEDATALGTAFHRLAQRSIIQAARGKAPFSLSLPDHSAIEAQARGNDLSEGQRQRLDEALERWFDSALAEEFSSHGVIAAEVPFMVAIERDGIAPLYLEGEIDGLAFDDVNGEAFFIDYKTGGSPDETAEQLHAKHLQQAQCYAYALMRAGFDAVEARFVRVERADPFCPDQPAVVKYSFDRTSMSQLEAAIVAAARQ